MPEISVIVPVYKAEKYLAKCVASVLAQTFTDFELILVDDGSPDNCPAMCDEYARKDARIRAVHKPNGGASSARNEGIKAAKGRRIAFIDADDYVSPDYLMHLSERDEDFVMSGLTMVDHLGNVLECKHVTPFAAAERKEVRFLDYLGMLYSSYRILFKSSIIAENNIAFPENTSFGEDTVFVTEYLKRADTFAFIDDRDYFYVQYPGQTSLTTKLRMDILDDYTYSLRRVIDNYKEISPAEYCEIKKRLENDMARMYVYYFNLIFTMKLPRNESIKYVERFISVPGFIQLTVDEKGAAVWDLDVYRALCEKEPVRIYKRFMLHKLNVRLKSAVKKVLSVFGAYNVRKQPGQTGK